ncbi:MAG: undecaprenyl-diphosphate phosphatase [Nanoarchaeota archaeon]
MYEGVLQGALRGVTEWIPLSYSGHVSMFGLSKEFEFILSIACLIVVLTAFRNKLKTIVTGALNKDKQSLRFLYMLFLGSIPFTVAVFWSLPPYFAGVGFLINGLFLISTVLVQKNGRVSPIKASFIGGFQALSVIPGVSRTGITISSAMLMGIRREDALFFSLMLSVPALILKMFTSVVSVSLEGVLAGLIALVLGYASLKFLIILVKSNKLWVIGVYSFVIFALNLLIST